MRTLLAAILVLLTTSAQAAGSNIEFISPSDDTVTMIDFTPTTMLTFVNPEGLEGTIDFGGKSIVYSGDLHVDESAILFFEAMFKQYLECSR